MVWDEMRASDVPVEGVSSRPFATAPVVGESRSVPAKLDKPLAAAHVIHSIPGRVRLRVPTLQSGSQLVGGLKALLSEQIGITEATVNTGCRSVTVVYEPGLWTAESICLFLHSRSREELEQHAAVLPDDATSLFTKTWLQPWRFLNATGSSPDSKGVQTKSGYWKLGYASMVVGAVLVPVPLVPGIPFLILASYCFAKATIWKTGDEPEPGQQVPKPGQ